MYELLTLVNRDDYFKAVSKRNPAGVYFCRFIGFDEENMVFFKKYQTAAQKKGIYLNKPMKNPTEGEVDYFFKETGGVSSLEAGQLGRTVHLWLKGVVLPRRQLFLDALMEEISLLQSQGMNLNILKNAFVKFMCWSRYLFEGVLGHLGDDDAPKVLYEGDISKYEVYMLRILSRAGCDICYVNFMSEDSYLNIDRQSVFSNALYCKRRGVPDRHFSLLDITEMERVKEMKEKSAALKDAVETNTWVQGDITEEIQKGNSQRGSLGQTKIYNLYYRLLGIDSDEQYLSRIYKMKQRLVQSGKPLVTVENRIGNPTIDEVKGISPVAYQNREDLIYKLAMKINHGGDTVLTAMVQNAFTKTMEESGEDTLPKLYNYGMKLLCWLKRYLPGLYQSYQIEAIPIFFCYGILNESEAEFLNMLSRMPVDVVLLSPDLKMLEIFARMGEKDRGMEERLGHSSPLLPFPKSEPKVKMATTAYNAERELDQLLYTGTGLFRNRQFTRSNPVTLKTTYDEIKILWKEEAKYRPGFEAEAGRVVVPNIFAKICGVPEGDEQGYFRTIESMLTEKTILIKKIPFITAESFNSIRPFVYKFFENGEICPEEIKKHKEYKYDFLSEDIQDYILEKLQQMIDLKWIEADTMGIEYAILATILNLDKNTLRLIQQFDFTRDIPKLMVIDVDEAMFSLEDCIYLLFLNLVGFDIVIFTPTGYRNLEKYVKEDAFEQYQIGQYLFNLTVPLLKARTQQTGSEGLFQRLFGKGRN